MNSVDIRGIVGDSIMAPHYMDYDSFSSSRDKSQASQSDGDLVERQQQQIKRLTDLVAQQQLQIHNLQHQLQKFPQLIDVERTRLQDSNRDYLNRIAARVAKQEYIIDVLKQDVEQLQRDKVELILQNRELIGHDRK